MKGKTVAVIPAAGSGVRMNSRLAKQFLDLDGRPVLAVTLGAFESCDEIDAMIVVAPAGDLDYCREEVVKRFGISKVAEIVPGGRRRQDSVRLGLEATRGRYERVVIHDGVRPLIDQGLLRRVLEAARTCRAVIAGLPARETVKEVDRHRMVVRTVDREGLWLIQTPQVFRYRDIWEAHRKALAEGWEEATDDAFLAERAGIPVTVVEGSERNIKVTTPADLELARFFLRTP